MKSRLIVLLCAIGLGCLGASAQTDTVATAAAPMELSLDDCLKIALSENPTVKVADMEITRTDYSKIETISQLLPQAAFSGSYSRAIAKQVMYMNMDFDDMLGGLGGGNTGDSPGADDEAAASRADSKKGGNDGGIKVGLDNSYQMGFSASVPLIAPQLWASLKLSDHQILQAVENARASRLNLINNVKSAYYALMLAYDSKKVLQESYDMARFTHELYTKQFELGAASDYDVLRTSVAMKNIE
ncbi:MAG: TolC family protein, partial [Muribaculaceae bacterium]|nr:TolC family protein [Muribaculaceae bacterium]